jgi:hypothetical protein
MDKDPVPVCEADVAAAFAEAASQRSSVSPISSSGRFAVHNTALSLQSLPPLTPPQLRSALSHALADTPTYTSAASTSSSLQCRLPPLPSGRMLASGALASPLCSTAKTYLPPSHSTSLSNSPRVLDIQKGQYRALERLCTLARFLRLTAAQAQAASSSAHCTRT